MVFVGSDSRDIVMGALSHVNVLQIKIMNAQSFTLILNKEQEIKGFNSVPLINFALNILSGNPNGPILPIRENKIEIEFIDGDRMEVSLDKDGFQINN